MNESDDWKASCAAGSKVTVSQYQRHNQRGATAGTSGLCFLEAFQAALYSIRVEHDVNVALWDAYVKAVKKDFSDGVDMREQVEFFRFVRGLGVKFDFMAGTRNLLDESITSVDKLALFPQRLECGVYIVHAGLHMLEHCFAMRVHKNALTTVIDAYVEENIPPCFKEPLSILIWIDKVYTVRRIMATSVAYKGRGTKCLKID